jgi:hypothetical protein
LGKNEDDPELEVEDEKLKVISSLKNPIAPRNRGILVTPSPPRMTMSQATRLVGESSQP